ncbi:helix-turn-helix transcriptional regulator [Microbacterium sp.]|uniref:helix-turn-helix transcriptional regulator n=1 Tax=Microbacterium sp. TaxID=51671 RepID=UPI0028109C92|nr:AraC family transcriptional regulator [Microbacterium sp.]
MAEILRMDSRDVADVEHIWTQYVPSARAQRIDPKSFGFRWRSAAVEGMSVVRYALTATVESSVQPEDQIVVCRVAAPAGRVMSGRVTLDTDLPWATDGREVRAQWEKTADVSAIILDRSVAQHVARQVTGDDLLTLRLTDVAPKSPGAGRYWNRMFNYVMHAVAAADDDPIIESTLTRHAVLTALSTFPSTFSEAMASEPRLSAPAVVRRAVEYMDSHAHEPITVDDVARAVHISTRGLQYAFRRALDTTPTAHLRRVRLDGAHRDLRNAGPAETVSAIARRWGFSNITRFAAAYRTVYGRSPRETLEQD